MEAPSIQWFPGHMTRTRRLIEKDRKLVDLFVELLDARIPFSSSNPDMERLAAGKPRLLLLNKADQADEKVTKAWVDHFLKKGLQAIPTDAKTGRGLQHFKAAAEKVVAPQRQRLVQKGMGGRTIRLMVVGIPNVGKSSLLNRLAKGKRAKVEDRPGVTRGRQWVTTPDGLEILDTAGILWPKFEDPLVGEKLAFTGAIKDHVLDMEHLAMRLLEYLASRYPAALKDRYQMEGMGERDGYALLKMLGKNRGMLMAGGEVNVERAAIHLLDEFRGGKLGRISLEEPHAKGK